MNDIAFTIQKELSSIHKMQCIFTDDNSNKLFMRIQLLAPKDSINILSKLEYIEQKIRLLSNCYRKSSFKRTWKYNKRNKKRPIYNS